MSKQEMLREFGFSADFIAAFREYESKISPVDISQPLYDPLLINQPDSGSYFLKVGPTPASHNVRIVAPDSTEIVAYHE